jgi:hypothetical protein
VRAAWAAPERAPRRTSERRREQLCALTSLVVRGLPVALASLAAGIHRTTAQRWQCRHARGELLVRRRGPGILSPPLTAWEDAAQLVRMAAEIKHEARRTIERERRREARRVHVTAPGILRGFDVMELGRRDGHVLIATDGCVPYRTSWVLSRRYDGPAVAGLLERDFAAHGSPLVLRLDRAAAHMVPAVRELLDAKDVLALQGPPYYARYYGQLERQNRDHRAWLAGALPTSEDLDDMMASLNGRWRRSTLGWCTAAEQWSSRPVIQVDRKALADDVRERAARIEHRLDNTPRSTDIAWRLAVSQALTKRGLLRIETGGWC